MNAGRVFIACWLAALSLRGSDVSGQKADYFPGPDYPSFATRNHQSGTVVLDVHFDQTGQVEKCSVKRTSAPKELTEYTRRFILSRWHGADFAGKSIEFPVKYAFQGERNFSSPPWPAIAAAYHQHGVVTLKISFDADGKVTACTVDHTTAPASLTNYTRVYAEFHWTSKADAGKTVLIPMIWTQAQNY